MIKIKSLPMKEAQKFWRDKVQLSPGQFYKLSEEAKIKAFAVAGIAKGDELTAIYSSLKKALDEGIPLGAFKKECRHIFEKRGWTGKRAWRVDNIFRTNIQTAFNVGRYKQMQEVKDKRPYWMYDAVNDRRTRPAHAALDGKVFPADHPFWDTWYPINGFRCRCGVISLSKRQVEKRNLTVEIRDPTGGPLMPPGATNPAWLLPDPGFDYHPGKTVWGGIVDGSARAGTFKDLPDLKKADDFRRKAFRNVRPVEIPDLTSSMLLPKGKSNDFYKGEFINRYGREKLLTDAAGEPVILSLRSFLADKTPGRRETWKFSKPGHGESVSLLQEMIEQPYEIWLVPQRETKSGRIRLTRRYVSLWKTHDKKRIGGLAAFEVSGGVFQGVTAFMPFKKGGPDIEYIERQRRGLLLYKKGR